MLKLQQDHRKLLPSKHHQRRIQCDRQEKVTDNNSAQRIDSDEVGDTPEMWNTKSSCDHDSSRKEAEDKSALESFDKFGHFLEEARLFDFLCGSAPGHINLEEMAHQCL
jgi:hypothetical protein